MEEENKNPKLATEEQLKKIDNSLQDLGYENGWDGFLNEMYTVNGRNNFAKSLSSQLNGIEQISLKSAQDGYYQPVLSQDLLQDININPRISSSEEIEAMLVSPQLYYDQLNSINQYLAYSVGVYRRTIWYFNTIKSFKYDLKPINIPFGEELNKDEYIKSYNKALDVLRKLNIKYQIPKMDLQVMYDGFAVYYISETSDNLTFIPLPSKFCYITAPYTFGWRVAFDLAYFDRYAVGLDSIPELKNAYDYFVELRRSGLRGDKTYKDKLTVAQYYPLPANKTATFTFDPIHPDRLPPLTSAMGSALDILSYRQLLKNQLGLSLYKLISLKIPLDSQTNKPAMTYEQASMITQAIASLLPENVIPFSSPFETEAINVDQTQKYEDIIKISNDSYYSASGTTQAVFGSSDIKQGTAIKQAVGVDFAYVSTHMYSQFDNVVNNLLWASTGKYKFKVSFFGNSLTDKEDSTDYASLVKTANMPVGKLFAYEGYEPFEVYGTLKSEDILGLKELMTPLVSAFNSKQDGGGAPTKNRVSDGGEISQDYGE